MTRGQVDRWLLSISSRLGSRVSVLRLLPVLAVLCLAWRRFPQDVLHEDHFLLLSQAVPPELGSSICRDRYPNCPLQCPVRDPTCRRDNSMRYSRDYSSLLEVFREPCQPECSWNTQNDG